MAFSDADAPPPPEDIPPFEFESLPPPEDVPPFDLEISPPPEDTPPQAAAASETREAPAAPGGWEEILAGLKPPKLPVGIFTILSDPAKTAAKLSDGELTLCVEPGFVMNNISRPDVTSRIAGAARELLGREVAVRVTEMGRDDVSDAEMPPAASPRADKLDELKRFGIVKFK